MTMIHAIAENAYEALKNTGVEKVVTCNTIKHHTNEIDTSFLILEALNSTIMSYI
jgi:phosphoribosylpyrophosphate synthetase